MKKNYELKYDAPKKKKLSKFNYVVITVPIVLILILVAGIAYWVFVINSNINRMIRYLEKDGYVCNKESCTKDFGTEIYTIDFVNNVLLVDSSSLQIRVGEESPIVDVKSKEMICTYQKDDYNWDFVDETFIYDKSCSVYVSKINTYLTYYRKIKKESLGE